MSFGFSLGDFFAVGQLAWNVYKSCKGAGGAFEELSHEVIALHTAIKELEDEIENPDSILNRTGAVKKTELGILVKNCSGVLQQLNKLLTKYKSLGTTSKRTWDRVRWGAENLQDIRETLLTHRSSLTLFLTTLGTGSLGRIEKKLDQLIQDVRAGRKEETVITVANGENDPEESEIQWGLLKEELIEDGFSKLEVEGHKHWIKAKLSELIESGGLSEEPLPEKIASSLVEPKSVQPPPYSENAEVGSHVSSERRNVAAFQPTVEDSDEDEETPKIGKTPEEGQPLQDSVRAMKAGEESEEEGAESGDGEPAAEALAPGQDDIYDPPVPHPRKSVKYKSLNEDSTSKQSERERKIQRHEEDERARQKWEKQSEPAAHTEKKTRDKQRNNGTEERPRTRAPYVEEGSSDDYRAARKREKSRRERRRLEEEIKRQNEEARAHGAADAVRRTENSEGEASDGMDDIFLASVLPTDSISQVGINLLTSTSRGLNDSTHVNGPDARKYPQPSYIDHEPSEATKSPPEEWARTFKPQTFTLPPRGYPHPNGTPELTRYIEGNRKPVQLIMPKVTQQTRYIIDNGRWVPVPQPASNRQPHASEHSEPAIVQGRPKAGAQRGGSRLKKIIDYSSESDSDSPVYIRRPHPSREEIPPPPIAKKFQATPPLTRTETFHAPPTLPRTSASKDPSYGYPNVPQPSSEGPGFNFNTGNQARGYQPQAAEDDIFKNSFGQGRPDGLENIFGTTAVPSGDGKGPSPRTPAQHQPEVTVVERPLPLTLEELFHGCHKKMKIKRKGFDAVTGARKMDDKVLEFDIKPGLKKGAKIKFRNVGDQEEGGRQDLHFIVEERKHIYTRDRDDLYLTVELYLVDSLCGFKRTITTIDGQKRDIEKDEPTGPESKDILPGLGMPNSKNPDERGDLIINYTVRYPRTLTKRQKVTLRQVLYDSTAI